MLGEKTRTRVDLYGWRMRRRKDCSINIMRPRTGADTVDGDLVFFLVVVFVRSDRNFGSSHVCRRFATRP